MRPASPFPRKRPDGTVVVDETCTCEHRRSEHADSIARGHGRCEVEGCECAKFSWAGELLVKAVDSIRGKKP